MFDPALRRLIAAQARAMRVEPAALLAVIEVESGGRTHARVKGRDEPLIRFEGHYFHRLLSGAKRARAVREGLAAPRWGTVKNPRTQSARWKMLERARRIDRPAADSSVSWGVGQVMGANWRVLGYASVAELVSEARSGVGGQVAVMVRFIRHHKLDGALRARDWRSFARSYNGPAYARHGYHTAMAKAYARHVRAGANATETGGVEIGPVPSDSGTAPKASTSPRWFNVTGPRPTLARGARGEAVRRVQHVLGLRADGLYGAATERAVRRFQTAQGLGADGMVGPRSWAVLEGFEDRGRLRAGLGRPFRAIVRLFAALWKRWRGA